MTAIGKVDPKPNIEALKKLYGDFRPTEQIREHYELEVTLADRLRAASASERPRLYGELYDELFQKLPHHPQLTRYIDQKSYADKQVRVLRHLVTPGSAFAEIGAGDARVSKALADICSQTTAFDVSDKVAGTGRGPANFRFSLTDGVHFDLPDESVDFVYSNQLMEHLHPDDVAAQLREIYRVLKPGGQYFCITPNRLCGPHDVSRYFDDRARGFHLREYTNDDLSRLFRSIGWSRTQSVMMAGGHFFGRAPASLIGLVERALSILPKAVRSPLTGSKPARILLGAAVLATK